MAPLPFAYLALALSYIKIETPGETAQLYLALGGLVSIAASVLWIALHSFRPSTSFGGTRALDRYHQLDDRITNALSFSRIEGEKRSALMQLAIDDCLTSVVQLAPRRAAPIRLPRESLLLVMLCGGLVLLALTEVPRGHFEQVSQQSKNPMLMTADDLDLFRSAAAKLEEYGKDPESLANVRRFNQLVEDISARRLSRPEAFSRLAALERRLSRASEEETQATEEGLKALAKELNSSELTKPLAESLEQRKLEDAEAAMRKLAERLRRNKNPPSKAELERLRKALKKASRVHDERTTALETQAEQLRAERRSLLNKKKQQGSLRGSEQKRLDKLERRLERLDRERKQSEAARKQMSELDKKLAEAARELMQAQGQQAAGEALDQGAEDLNRMAEKELTRKEKERLLEQLRQLKDLLRQQGASGKQRVEQLQRFGEKARGRDGKGQSGKARRPGALVPRMGAGGIPIPIKPGAQGSQPQAGQDGQKGGNDGQGAGTGKDWGNSHDPSLTGDASELGGKTQDVTAAAQDTGQGSASSEVISGAAKRGFVGRQYQNVYTDYQGVAERVLEDEDIPPGYRFYVKRYFQLIRPRE